MSRARQTNGNQYSIHPDLVRRFLKPGAITEDPRIQAAFEERLLEMTRQGWEPINKSYAEACAPIWAYPGVGESKVGKSRVFASNTTTDGIIDMWHEYDASPEALVMRPEGWRPKKNKPYAAACDPRRVCCRCERSETDEWRVLDYYRPCDGDSTAAHHDCMVKYVKDPRFPYRSICYKEGDSDTECDNCWKVTHLDGAVKKLHYVFPPGTDDGPKEIVIRVF